MDLKTIIAKWKNDYNFKTIVNSAASFFITLIFAIYNIFLGIRYIAVWNLSIGIYYIFLAVIRGIIINQEKNYIIKGIDNRNKIHMISSVLLTAMNLALIMPITLMVIGKRNIKTSMIPAISIATYTTFKIITASINLKKSKKSDDILIKDLRNINFIDAVVSVLTLQNTLIVAKGADNQSEMFRLSAIMSGIGLALIIILTILNIRCKSKK